MREPSGAMAMAGKSGRSLAGEATMGPWYEAPRFVDHSTIACSLGPGADVEGVGPSHHVTTTSSVAPPPVGAPLAMSRVGNEPSRAPATPSKVKSPETGSGSPHWSKCATARGFSKVLAPSNERATNT